jgi:hypothetical protein
MSWRLHVILRTVHFDYHSLIVKVHRNRWYRFFNHRYIHKESRSHSDSMLAVSNAVSSASIVDLVKMVCLQDLQETTLPPSRNTYPLVAYISSASESNWHHNNHLVPSGTQYSEYRSSQYLLDNALLFQELLVIISWSWNKPAQFAHSKRDVRSRSTS